MSEPLSSLRNRQGAQAQRVMAFIRSSTLIPPQEFFGFPIHSAILKLHTPHWRPKRKGPERKRASLRDRSWFAWFAAAWLGVLFLGTGCIGIGPKSVKNDRYSYNTEIQKSNNQQLLLNLVRLKYRDTPYFLEVSSIASQFTLKSNANAAATLQDGVKGLFGFGAKTEVEESPTITYAPLRGEQFITRFLAQVSLESVFLLFQSGWNIDQILRICLNRMGSLRNAPSASGPTPAYAPVFKDFVRASRLIRQLQLKDALTVSLERNQTVPELVFEVNGGMQDSAEVIVLNTLLGLPPDNSKFILSTVTSNHDSESRIQISTRSLLGIMYYLSNAVVPPKAHREAGKITLTLDGQGKEFNWDEVTGDILKIPSQQDEPAAAAVAVDYRDHWFYIYDSDLTSKSTFSLLAQIFSLQAGNVREIGPLLTLPIGN